MQTESLLMERTPRLLTEQPTSSSFCSKTWNLSVLDQFRRHDSEGFKNVPGVSKAFNEMTSGSHALDQDDAQRIAAAERASLPTALLDIVFFVISAVLAVIGEMFDNIFTSQATLEPGK